MAAIPLTWTFNGQYYTGHLSEMNGTMGSENNLWQLYEHREGANYYCGMLQYRITNPPAGEFFFLANPVCTGWEELAEYFGQIITAWYE